jgi:hypothetical protein
MYRGSSHEPKLRVRASDRARGSGAFRDTILLPLYGPWSDQAFGVDRASTQFGRLTASSSAERAGQPNKDSDLSTGVRAEARGLSVKPARERPGGEIGSENVDMSSDKAGERPARRKSKGSCLKLI